MKSVILTKFPRAATVALLGAGLLTAGLAIETSAASPNVANAVKARQASFKTMGAGMRTLNQELSGSSPSTAKVQQAARSIAGAAKTASRSFPAGSGPSAGVSTDALAVIWTKRPSFDAQMTRLVTEADKLAKVSASGDPAAIRSQMKATGAVCGSCHKQFRSR